MPLQDLSEYQVSTHKQAYKYVGQTLPLSRKVIAVINTLAMHYHRLGW